MKKTLITLFLALVIIVTSFAQSKEISFAAEGKRTIVLQDISDNGDVFFVTGKNLLSVKRQEKKMFKFDSNLDKIFTVNLKGSDNKEIGVGLSPNPSYNGMSITESGNYVDFFSNIVDEKGKVKNYEFKKNTSGDVNVLFKFTSNNYKTFIGPLKGRKNYKKKYSGGDIFVFSRKHSDFSTTQEKLDEAPINSNLKEGSTVSWSVGETFDNHFNLLAKDDINENRTVDTYHVASYGYDGKIKAVRALTVKLDSGHFLLSTNGGPSEFDDANYGSFASGNIHTDDKTGAMYVYGFYTDRAKRKMIMGKYKGFYIYKFDVEGVLVWKKQQSFNDHDMFRKTYNGSQVHISHNKISDSEAIVRVSSPEDGYFMYKFNTESGKLIETKDVFFEMKNKKYRRPYMNKELFPKKYFSFNASSALYLKKSIYNYVSKLDPETKIYLDAKILKNGTILLTHYDVKVKSKIEFNETKILKFDD